MARTVTMAEFYQLKAAIQRMREVSGEAALLATDGNQIMRNAADDGAVDWGLRFGLETMANLTELQRQLIADCEDAAVAFTGEKRRPRETFQAYWARIGKALGDLVKLDAMMKRNGISFVNT